MVILICLIVALVAGAVAWYSLERECGDTHDSNPNWPFPKDRP